MGGVRAFGYIMQCMYYIVHTLHFDSVKKFWQPQNISFPLKDYLDFSLLHFLLKVCYEVLQGINRG
jgi:hypothetical protein